MSKSKSFLLLLLFVLSVSLYAESCRLLIVCHESFTEDIEDFVKWKHDIGWAPYVLEIDATTGRSSSSIKSEINSCIGSMDEIPEYILIIGGDELMRMGYLNSATSDSYYGDLDSDNRTEIPVGRFPGTYESEIRSLVAKTMSYAQDPEVDGDYSWLKKASLLRGGSDSHYTSFMNTLNGILEEYDYEVSLHTTSDAGVLSEINEGLGYIIFRGSGVEGWGGFYITPTDLRNGSNTPIVSGTTCATIRSYGPSWVNVGSEANPKGGVIYIGSNTVSSGHDLMMQRSAMAEGFYQGFLHGMTTGQATENGRQYVLHYGGIACDREYSSLNMMGDPTIWVWTDIPHEISVEHFPFYVMGDEEFGIEVTFEDEPVESALCCISIEDDLYVWGYTDLDGYVNMEYSYIGEGTDSLLISVVGFNIKPYYSKVACRVDGPRPYVTNSWIDDTETGNGDTLLSRNEICEVKAIIRNIGSTDCGEITAILTSESPFITITDSIIEISSLASDTEILPTDNFQFQVNENAPVDERIAYAITLYSDDAEYISNSNTPFVVGANIVFSEPIIVDITPWGNNNSVLDYGENATLNIEASNIGDVSANDLRLTVSCTTDELIFPFPRTYLNYIARDTSASLMPIPVICNPNNITDSIAVVIYELEAIDGGYTNFTQTDTFEIIYNNASRTSTGPDSYGYFMYDNTDTYSRRNPEYMWTELSGIGTRNRRLSSSENGVETISLPFDFRYYGLDYSEITITTEGYFTAGITYSCESYPEHIPFTSYPYPSVAIAWDDLYPIITGDIYTYYDEEHGKFLIQYDYITDSECNISTFEVAICDNEIYPTPTGDNEIYFYYQDSLFTSTKVVGIQNQSATSGLCYLENGEYNTSATNIVPETALRITTYPPDPDDVVNVYSTNYEISDLVGGDSDGRCEETETIDIIVLLENLGGLDAENIKVFLTTVEDRADIDIISDTVYVDGIDAESRLALPENLRFTFNSLDYDIDARFDIHVITNDGESCHIQPIYIPLREQLNIEDSQPTDYEIAKVYPNPFNSSINFELPSDRSIIEIYSTDGKLLERHTPSAHVYKLDWHSSEYSTGIYLYRIFSEKDEVSGKIVYIK